MADGAKKRGKDGKRDVRARKLAEDQIDKMSDASATDEKRTSRKHRLSEGPGEFRESRVDQRSKRSR